MNLKWSYLLKQIYEVVFFEHKIKKSLAIAKLFFGARDGTWRAGKLTTPVKSRFSFKEQSPAEKQNKYSHNPSKFQNQFPKNAWILSENLRFFVVVYGIFDARDGLWGSEGKWAEKDPTHKEWGAFVLNKSL